MQAALDQRGFRPEAMKVVVLITDEPALQRNLRPATITGRPRQAGAIAFVLSPNIKYFRSMANDTRGYWWKVDSRGDFSPILDHFDKMPSKATSTVAAVQNLTDGTQHER